MRLHERAHVASALATTSNGRTCEAGNVSSDRERMNRAMFGVTWGTFVTVLEPLLGRIAPFP